MRQLILGLLTLLGTSTATAQQNVVVIVSDQFAYWATDPAQRAPLELPNLDALASRGTRFTRCFTTSPVCSANRLALLTGQYPFTLGTNKLQPGVPTMGTLFKAAGYDTGYIGKWHLSPSTSNTGYVAPGDRPGWRYFAGNESAPHNYLTGVSFKHNNTAPVSTAPWEPTWQTTEALRFLKAERAKPFLLVVNFGPPHPAGGVQGYTPPEELYSAAQITPRPNVDAASWPQAQVRIADYSSLAVTTDNELGVLLSQINLATTYVVFTSDHGDLLFSHGAGPKQQKRHPWQEAVRVPLVIAGPGLDAREDGELISTIDILPSLLDLVGLPIPDAVQGRALPQARPAYFGHDQQGKSWMGERWRGLADGSVKYAVTQSGAGELLFDLAGDPFELNDLSLDPAYAGVLNAMRAQCRDYARGIGDPFFGGAR